MGYLLFCLTGLGYVAGVGVHDVLTGQAGWALVQGFCLAVLVYCGHFAVTRYMKGSHV